MVLVTLSSSTVQPVAIVPVEIRLKLFDRSTVSHFTQEITNEKQVYFYITQKDGPDP